MKMNVKIIGIGGAGLNMVNAVIDAGFEPENAVYIDTSRNAVCAAKTDNFLELGMKIFTLYQQQKALLQQCIATRTSWLQKR
jgi:cell division GTPase FtsZ